MHRCIIVDDEPYAIEGLKRYISSIAELTIMNCYTDPLQALVEISAGDQVDLVLLDIDMPNINGIELAKEIRNKTNKLVFTTAHTKYGYDAFEVNADAFLLKPYSQGKFLITYNKLFPKLITKETTLTEKDDFIFIKSKDDHQKLLKVKYEDIIAVESNNNYVMIYTLHKNIITYMSLSEISKKLLTMPAFLQYQRSFIIAKAYIEFVDGNTIQLVNGVKMTVGDYYRKDFNNFLNNNMIKARRKV